MAQQNTDTIHWRKDYKLKWEDFQGVPDSNSIGVAGTSIGYECIPFYAADSNLNFIINCAFFKNISWAKNFRTPYILNHEQGHFNIAEVYARTMQATLNAYKFPEGNVTHTVKSIYDSITFLQEKFQERYDAETNNSQNKFKQKEWDSKIKSMLNK
ncbi:MAG: hypothetical protein EOO43_06385 [Flavobacterium sp.]|nr:MAG: hypothetical protein EOO43_06385 [Flavobacterium sp.]